MFKNIKADDKKLIFLKKSIWIYFILLVLFFSLVIVVHALAMTLITIPNKVELNKKIIELADIADFDGDNSEILARMKGVELGLSPSPGEEKTLDRNYIVLRLKKEGFDPKNFQISCNEKVVLHRSSKNLTKDQLEKIVKEKLSKYLGLRNDRIVIQDLKGMDDLRVPQGEITYKLEIRGKMSKYGRLVGNLDIIIDGELYKKLWIQARLSLNSKVGKLKRDIKKGEVISEEDIVFHDSAIEDMSRDYITDKDEISGLVASRNCRKGTILYRGLFTKPNVINRGDEVMIVVNISSLKITAAGVALENGGLGDMIKVRNETSKKTMEARITSKGKVVVG
ncbi:flagellar basal body P-ring formation chaperone FlgA [bacterium]|nr:flagellar basal body P-ring formation chaperone FlgA [bacterium]